METQPDKDSLREEGILSWALTRMRWPTSIELKNEERDLRMSRGGEEFGGTVFLNWSKGYID